MTSLNGYIQGLGSGAARIVRKTGKEIKLSVFDNIDRVIVFNEAGETSQTQLIGFNIFDEDTETGSINTSTGNNTPDNERIRSKNYISINPNTVYYCTSLNNYNVRIFYYDSNKDFLEVSQYWIKNTTFTSIANAYYIRIVELNSIYEDDICINISNPSYNGQYEPYCGGVPSPNPSYPQAIEGIGSKRQDGTYTVRIDYDDGDEHFGSITASGLAYPLYEGDILDFVNGKVIRANGYQVFDGSESWSNYTNYGLGFSLSISDMLSQNYGNGKSNRFVRVTSSTISSQSNGARFGGNNNRLYLTQVNITGVSDLATWQTWLSNNETYIVYPLASPVDEYITLTGDISDIGTATVLSDGTLTVKYDKVEMAIRKYSSPPDWSKIGYSATPNAIIDAFNYSKQIYDTWSFVKFTSDLNLRIFPNVDISGQLGLNGMFKGCTNLISLPPLEIGTDSGTLNASEFARNSGIEEVDITSNNLSQENNFQNGFNGCSYLERYSITAKVSNVNAMFSGCSSLAEAPDFDTLTTSNFSEMFSGCSSLTYVSDDFDTSSGTNFYRCFYNCSSLENIPSWNLRNGTNLQQLFAGCSSIKNVPPLVITAATNLTNMFQNSGSNLTELSRNNILMMLATASAYTGTKTLAAVGFTSSMYTAASWQALTNYNDFVTAGWSIGYN